ncbi:MAG: metallophosphoesterase [Steroidobacteraceae bacterium]
MKSALRIAAALAAFLAVTPLFADGDSQHGDSDSLRPLTLAVFGDWPYSQYLLDNAHLLVDSVNSDRDVDLVVHVGDLHSGSMPCTSAGILPPIATSSPGWNQAVFYQFQQFREPVVYTPGDNEWADCHKSKQFSSGAPLKELSSVRSLFFSQPGRTLGRQVKQVSSQTDYFDPAFPADSQFVENLMWMDSRVVFATMNIPGGSNDDASPWSGTFADPAAQAQEATDRRAANLRWLQTAFDQARSALARAVVLIVQADMWDPEALAAGGAGLGNYTPFVAKLADLSLQFRRPVLLLNGDTHLYHADQPLADPASATGVIHHTPAVPNLTRIVVQGSTNNPGEWLRLRIDPRTSQVFSWQNVVYCTDPAGSVCQ